MKSPFLASVVMKYSVSMSIFGKINYLHSLTKIHFLLVLENYIYALPKSIKYLTIDGQVSFNRWPFANAVEPLGCIFWPWGH